jgi:hypothetical protein
MKRQTIYIEEVGEVFLERSARARRIILTVRSPDIARVVVPRGVTFETAEAFARDKAWWLKVHLAKLAASRQGVVDLCRRPLNRADARRRILHRLAELATQHGFCYGRVYLRNQRTRWGSCSRSNNLSLNINLIRLPSNLMDYVLLHELIHTRIKNHGAPFWDELNRLMDGARGIDHRLDDFRGLLGCP